MTKIIAELCQNHLGKKDILSDSIDQAALAGTDYLKFQIIFSEDLTDRQRFEEGEVENNGVIKTIKRPYSAEFDRLKKLDLSEDDYKFIIDQCNNKKIIPMATIFSRNRIELASKLEWPEKIVKVASYDCASYKMIDELCDIFDHLVISVGATLDFEIKEAAELVKKRGKKLTFLHCVTSYPNSLNMCNLERMSWLRRLTDSVGWSDHTLVERDHLIAAKVAIMLGADFIERHFTILEKDQTKDGPISINPGQLRELVDFIGLTNNKQKEIIDSYGDWHLMLGDKDREMTHTEILNRDYYRGRFASRVGKEWVYNWENKGV